MFADLLRRRVSHVITAAALICSMTLQSPAFAEPRQYQVGEIKVGDTVSVDPGAQNRWRTCTVTVVVPILIHRDLIDHVEVDCPSGAQYSIVGDTDHMKRLSGPVNGGGGGALPRNHGGVGGAFGTRNPVACASTAEPRSGPPSPELAGRYLQCGIEYADDTFIHLITNVQVQVDRPRPFNFREDSGGGVDTYQLVYPIHGSYRIWSCIRLSATSSTAVGNCRYADHVDANGACRRLLSRNWNCYMRDSNHDTRLSDVRVKGPQ